MTRGADDAGTAARLERIAEIEAKIDPELRRRGRVLADLITVAIVVPLAIALDFHVTRPWVMIGLLLFGSAQQLPQLFGGEPDFISFRT